MPTRLDMTLPLNNRFFQNEFKFRWAELVLKILDNIFKWFDSQSHQSMITSLSLYFNKLKQNVKAFGIKSHLRYYSYLLNFVHAMNLKNDHWIDLIVLWSYTKLFLNIKTCLLMFNVDSCFHVVKESVDIFVYGYTRLKLTPRAISYKLDF